MEIKLYAKSSSYTDKNTGEVKNATRFYLECGNTLVPIEVTYFENAQLGRDPQYASRKAVLKAFAAPLPEKEGNVHG